MDRFRLIYFVGFAALQLYGVFASPCFSGSTNKLCTCEKWSHGWKSSCSGLNLTSSPVFRRGVLWVDLSRNKLNTFPDRTSLPDSLKYLNLSWNPLNYVNKSAFKNLPNLEELRIANTLREFDSNDFKPDIFRELKRLKYLDMKNKKDSKSPYPADALSALSSLEVLLINGKQSGFGEPFQKLKNLTTLDISGENGNCAIPNLRGGYFQNVKSINVLALSWCNMRNIEETTFGQLPSLIKLDISNNMELSFDIMLNVTRDLRKTNIEVFKANRIHCLFGPGTQLMIRDVVNLNATRIKELYVDSNRIASVESGAIMFLPRTLEHLSIADNELTFGLYCLELANLVNLKVLNASFQHSYHDYYDIYVPCNENRRHLQRSNKSITTLANPQKPLKAGIVNFFHTHLNEYVGLPQRVETIYLNSCGFKNPFRTEKYSNNKVRHVYLQDNTIYNWIGPVLNVEFVETMNLSNNFCTGLSTQFLDGFVGLKTLLMNGNLIGYSLQNDVNGLSFKNLRNLTTLEMTSNKISILATNIFFNLTSLKLLRLSNNLMRDFNVDIGHMLDLDTLDLSHNELTTLKRTTINSIDIIGKKKPRFQFVLAGNPLRCDCDNLDFIRWTAKSKNIVFNSDDFCLSTKATNGRVNMTNIAEFLVELESQCRSYIALIICMVCLVVLTITIILCAIIHRYRWKLRYLYYIMKSQYFGHRTLRRSNTEKTYEYDAFISYADEDRNFAFHRMLENVENEGARLCFHNRDFIPGFDIAENITTAIHNSRKTVCVMSESFLKSYWCMYELNIARMETIYSRKGDDTLFLIVYGNLAMSDLPMTVLDLVEKKSYIEYPNDPYGDVVFWKKLRDVISMNE